MIVIRFILLMVLFILGFSFRAQALEPNGRWNVEVGLSANNCGIASSGQLFSVLVIRIRRDGKLQGIDTLSGLRYRGRVRPNGMIVFRKTSQESVGTRTCEVRRTLKFLQIDDTTASISVRARLECPGADPCGVFYQGAADR